MKKTAFWWLGSAGVMLLLPFLAVTFAPSDAGMAICFLLFFAVNPIYCIFCGIWAGWNWQKHAIQPVLAAVLFLAGAWLLFDSGERLFIVYAGIYLLMGMVAMALSVWYHKWKKA